MSERLEWSEGGKGETGEGGRQVRGSSVVPHRVVNFIITGIQRQMND